MRRLGAKTLLLGAGLGMLLVTTACGPDRDDRVNDQSGAPTAGARAPGATGTTLPGAPPPARVTPPAPAPDAAPR
jgi:hypothetical protein